MPRAAIKKRPLPETEITPDSSMMIRRGPTNIPRPDVAALEAQEKKRKQLAFKRRRDVI